MKDACLRRSRKLSKRDSQLIGHVFDSLNQRHLAPVSLACRAKLCQPGLQLLAGLAIEDRAVHAWPLSGFY
jgi:hypothetical protein